MRKVFKYIILAVIAVNVAVLLWVIFGSASAPHVVLPNPNGYDDFVKAGEKLAFKHGYATFTPTNYYDFQVTQAGIFISKTILVLPTDEKGLRDFIKRNTESRNLVWAGLSKECRMPIDYSTNFFASQVRVRFTFEDLCLILRAEGNLAQIERHTNNALHLYLTLARFGQEFCRGGFAANVKFGQNCEDQGLNAIRQLLANLDAEECRSATRELEEEDNRREPVADIIARDKILFRRTSGLSLKEKLVAMIKARSLDPIHGQHQAFVADANKHQAEARQLILDLAARAYELEKGKRAQSVAELVPEYLKAVPKDPATGKDLSLLGR